MAGMNGSIMVNFAKQRSVTAQICVQGVLEALVLHRRYNSVLLVCSNGRMASEPACRKCLMGLPHCSLKRLVADLAWAVVQTTLLVVDLIRAIEEPELVALQMLSRCH